MKKLLIFTLMAASYCFAADVDNIAYHASQVTLVGGIATNIVESFGSKPSNCQNVFGPPTCELHPISELHPDGYITHFLVPQRPIGKTMGLSIGTLGVIVAEHYIVKKYPRSKRWLSVINFSVGGTVAYTGAR